MRALLHNTYTHVCGWYYYLRVILLSSCNSITRRQLYYIIILLYALSWRICVYVCLVQRTCADKRGNTGLGRLWQIVDPQPICQLIIQTWRVAQSSFSHFDATCQVIVCTMCSDWFSVYFIWFTRHQSRWHKRVRFEYILCDIWHTFCTSHTNTLHTNHLIDHLVVSYTCKQDGLLSRKEKGRRRVRTCFERGFEQGALLGSRWSVTVSSRVMIR